MGHIILEILWMAVFMAEDLTNSRMATFMTEISILKWLRATVNTGIVMGGPTKEHGKMIYRVAEAARPFQMDKHMKANFTRAAGMAKEFVDLLTIVYIGDNGKME